MKHLVLLLLWMSISQAPRAQQLIDLAFLESISLQEIRLLNPFAQYGCDAYQVRYTTTDINGQLDTASGALFLPDVGGQAYPLLIYQHGTRRSKFDVASRGAFEITPYAAGMGYIGLAPDLLGFGDSRGFHPYVHAASEASAAIDMLLAIADYLIEQDIPYNDQLFITGYSQGGHSGAALHRAIEEGRAGDFSVTAAAHMSGPYSISGIMAELIFEDDEEYFFPAFFGNAFLSYNEVYDLYDSTRQVFRQPYADMIDAFYANWESGLNSLGFDFLNEQLKDSLRAREGGVFLSALFQDSIRNILANEPDHPLSQALQDNDVFDWAPQAPTRLYYCQADDRVPFTNSTLADSVMNAGGAANTLAVDVGPTLDHDECVIPAGTQMILFFEGFKEITSTSQPGRLAQVSAYPNPTSGRLFLAHAPLGSEVRLFSPEGRLAARHILRRDPESLDLSGLSPGMYCVQIVAPEGSWSGRILFAN